MLNPHWGRGATGKQKKSCVVLVQLFATLWTVTRQASLSRGLSRQEDWSVLAHIGCHTLLEHYISCFPRHQHPWVPGADITPATQEAELPPYLAFTGTDPSPSGQPQEQNPRGQPTCRGRNKTTMKPRGSVAKEEDPKPSHQLYKLKIKSTWPTRQTLPIEYKKGHWELSQKHTSSDSCGHWRQDHTGVGPD